MLLFGVVYPRAYAAISGRMSYMETGIYTRWSGVNHGPGSRLQRMSSRRIQQVENIVAKREIARFEQFLLLSLCFQKAVWCRDVRKRLYEGKG